MGRIGILAALLLCISSLSFSQAPSNAVPGCALPPLQVKQAPGNFFTEEQEEVLGEMMAGWYQQRIHIVRDEALSAYVREVGDRIVAQLPTSLRYRFEVIEYPEANAFSLPGGRVYISRKIVAQLRSEDELAALLAHEIGHSATHQHAATISRLMQKILKIDRIITLDDVRTRYHELLNNEARKSVRINQQEEQIDADLLALGAMTRAGYDPQAFAIFFDRFAETKSPKRGFLQFLFGAYTPDTKRLFAIQKGIEKRSASCTPSPAADNEKFRDWQEQVLAYSSSDTSVELLSGLEWKRKLSPVLRSEIHHVRYSPDGKHVIAQDAGTIHVLTRDPLATVLRIPAPGAAAASFSSDSQFISFSDGNEEPRIEIWSVSGKKRLSVHELHMRIHCAESKLARDGDIFACVSANPKQYGFDLVLYDVRKGTEFYRQPMFLDWDALRDITWQRIGLLGIAAEMTWDNAVTMDFTPDGRYFLAARGEAAFCFDLLHKQPVKLQRSLKNIITFGFAFLGSDRILGRRFDKKGATGEILSFPGGQVLKTGLNFGITNISPAANADYVLLRPVQGFAVGVFDTKEGKFVIGGKKSGIDIWADEYAGEEIDGRIVRVAVADQSLKTSLDLSEGNLGRIHAAAVNPDLSWFALSDRRRGGVWNLTTGNRRFHIPNFDGAYFQSGTVYVDVPPTEKGERSITAIDLQTGKAAVTKLPAKLQVTQFGSVMIATNGDDAERTKGEKESETDTESSGRIKFVSGGPRPNFAVSFSRHFECRDASTQKVLWTKSLQEGKRWEANPEADSFAFLELKKGVYSIEFLQLSTGKELGKLTIDTGKASFSVRDAFASGGYYVTTDSQGRVTVYRHDGTQLMQTFGAAPAIAPATGLLVVRSEYDQLAVLDVTTGNRMQVLQFPRRVVFRQFAADEKHFIVVTGDQTAYLFDTAKLMVPNPEDE